MRHALLITLVIICLLVTACSTAEELPEANGSGNVSQKKNTSQPGTEGVRKAGHDETRNVSPRTRLQQYLNMRPSFKVTYDVVTRYHGKTKRGTDTVIVAGNKSVRKTGNQSLYILNDTVYLCRSDACYHIPQRKPPKPVDTSLPPNSTVSKHSERRIAGVDSTCFTVEYRGGTILDCRAQKTGVLTRYEKKTPRYTVKMRAQSVMSVPKGAFTLPHDPVNISRMPSRGNVRVSR